MRINHFIYLYVLFVFLTVPFTALADDITFAPSISVRGEFDDNVYYTRAFETEDYLTRIRPAFMLDWNTELLDIRSSFDVDIQRYADEDDLDTEDQHYSLDGSYQITERVSLTGNASYAEDTTLESELAETGLIGNTRQDRQRYTGGMGFSYNLSEISNITVEYNHTKTDYDYEGNVDYDVDSISLSFSSRFNNQLDVFTVQPYFYRYDSKASKVHNYGLSFGYQHPFSETLTLTAFAGVRYTKIKYSLRLPFWFFFVEVDEQDSSWAGVADINLEKTGEVYSASVGYNHDLSYSSYGEPIERYQITCTGDRKITERLNVRLTGDITFTESEGDFNDRDSRYYGASPSLHYQITEQYSLMLGYRYSQAYDKKRSTDPRADRNRVWLELRFRFPEKW